MPSGNGFGLVPKGTWRIAISARQHQHTTTTLHQHTIINIARTTHVKAGFSFSARDGNSSKVLHEQIGPVITAAGPFAAPTSSRYKGAERGTSQTAELTGLLEQLE